MHTYIRTTYSMQIAICSAQYSSVQQLSTKHRIRRPLVPLAFAICCVPGHILQPKTGKTGKKVIHSLHKIVTSYDVLKCKSKGACLL